MPLTLTDVLTEIYDNNKRLFSGYIAVSHPRAVAFLRKNFREESHKGWQFYISLKTSEELEKAWACISPLLFDR